MPVSRQVIEMADDFDVEAMLEAPYRSAVPTKVNNHLSTLLVVEACICLGSVAPMCNLC